MPDEQPKPVPQQPATDGTGGLWAIGWKVFGMSAEQQRGVVVLVLTGFLLWLVYDSLAANRVSEAERNAMVMRVVESEGEKNRRAADEASNRAATAVNESTKLIVASHQRLAVELGKFEQRVADLTAANAKLEQRLAELSAELAALRKKLPPSEVQAAPAPRPKAFIAG
jgi:septal ring factor EnvC (AmiA/AmiB activator)